MPRPLGFLRASILAGLFSPALPAAVTNVQVVGATATQALLSYLAPDETACVLEVSESSSFRPLIPDVDPSLFPGADRDDRAGDVSSGPKRLAILGRRTADIASNGHRYSRALQAATPHFFRITCGSDQATGSFSTANIPLGKTYGEIPPVDRDNPGQYAWPEMLWTDSNPRMTDPLTGILYKPLTRPTVSGPGAAAQPFQSAADLGGQGEWSNPAGALGNTPATYSGANRSWLFLRITDFTFQNGADWYEPSLSMSSFQVQWKAAGDPVDVCLTVNGIACSSAVRTISLPAKASDVTVGTQDLNLAFWTDATHLLNRPDMVHRGGTVAVDTSGAVSYIGGTGFNPHWIAGSRITIGKSDCRISTLQNNQNLTIDPASCQPALNLPIQSAAYNADNFGVLVRKSSPGLGSVSIQSARYSYTTAREPGWPAGAHTLYCADQPVADSSTPVQHGFHCNVYGGFYWINPATGDARFLGTTVYLNASLSGDNLQGCWIDAAAFDPANPNRFYCQSATAQGLPVILRGEYTGDHSGLGIVDTPSSEMQATWTNLTPAAQGRDLRSLVHQFDSDYDPALFSNCAARGAAADGKLLITCQRGPQDTLGWEVVFDPATTAVVAAYRSWDKQPGRWCKLHSSAAVIGSDSWARIEFAYNSDTTDPGGGAWQSHITSGALSAKTLDACPTNPFGVTGNACSQVTVEGEPCDFSPGTGEPHNCPYNPNATFLMNAAPGDLFLLDQEWVRLIAKNDTQWVLERSYRNLSPLADHAADKFLVAMCSTNAFADITLWNFREDPHGSNAGGNTVLADLTGTSHSSVAKDSIQGSASWRDCPTGLNGCLSVRTGNDVRDWISQPATALPVSGPKFAGQPGIFYENTLESYSSFPPTSPNAPDRGWFLYNRPFTSDANLNKLTSVSGQLYKVNAPALHRKLVPTFAMCGPRPLVDVSGLHSLILDDSSDAYRYCVANAAGECSDPAGSRTTSAGDIFVNCPNVAVPLTASCTGGPEGNGVCLADNASYAQSVVQVSTKLKSTNGQDARVLTHGFRPYRAGVTYWNSRELPDGSWALLWTQWFNLQRTEAFLAKLPPFPAPDTTDRSNFEPMGLYVAAVDGATSAVIDFGYAENGPSGRFFCTSRRETCVRGNQPGNDYSYASETVDRIPCQNGCTIQVPAIPERILYYRARYFDDSGELVMTSPTWATVVP
jgi:hypothetical protein